MTGKEDVIMATTETFVPGRLYNMPLADLQQDPNQLRKYIDPDEMAEGDDSPETTPKKILS